MELKDTIELMTSDDYKDRFKAEYLQMQIRYKKLLNLITQWKMGTLSFVPDSPMELLLDQLDVMEAYLKIMKQRAVNEKIDLKVK